MSNKVEVFREVLDKYETEEIKAFVEEILEDVDDYIYIIPSSTSLKYHNKTQCQDGGQVYHIIMACTIMNHILDLKYMKEKFTQPKKRDAMRAAILLHDMKKTNGGQYTVHEHPVLAQEWVTNYKAKKHDIDDRLKAYIGRLCASHSGEWTTSKRSSVVLPEVENDEQFLVHLCDYLGSRSNLDMIYTDYVKELIDGFQTPLDPKVATFRFGKFKGEKYVDIPMSYMSWAYENMNALNSRERKCIKELLNKFAEE